MEGVETAVTEHAANAVTAGEAHGAEGGKGVHIELAAEKLGEIGGFPVTNTLVTSWIVMAILIVIALIVGRKASLIPSRFQTFFEMLFESIQDFISGILGDKVLARRFFPLLVTLFLFIAVSNAIEFTPGIGSLYVQTAEGHAPLFRSVNTDLNVTLALTLITMVVIELAGVFALGLFRYAGKFINFSSPLNFAVGLIELVSEAGRLVSFSFRLFGNVFAGEVLIAVAMFFMPYVLPVPLMAFEMFVGIIQAAVFPLLALFFIKIAIADPHGAHAKAH